MKKLSRLMQGVHDVSSSASLPARSQINESTPSSVSEHKPHLFDIPASRCSPSKLAPALDQQYQKRPPDASGPKPANRYSVHRESDLSATLCQEGHLFEPSSSDTS